MQSFIDYYTKKVSDKTTKPDDKKAYQRELDRLTKSDLLKLAP